MSKLDDLVEGHDFMQGPLTLSPEALKEANRPLQGNYLDRLAAKTGINLPYTRLEPGTSVCIQVDPQSVRYNIWDNKSKLTDIIVSEPNTIAPLFSSLQDMSLHLETFQFTDMHGHVGMMEAVSHKEVPFRRMLYSMHEFLNDRCQGYDDTDHIANFSLTFARSYELFLYAVPHMPSFLVLGLCKVPDYFLQSGFMSHTARYNMSKFSSLQG